MSKKSKEVGVCCGRCGGDPKNHCVVGEHEEHRGNEEIDVWYTYQIIKCMGCDSVRFRQFETCSESRDWETGELDEYDEAIFPEGKAHKHQPIDNSGLPEDVAKMYLETVLCFNAGSNTLAGGGLRATVEALCLQQQVKGNNLEKRIDSLVEKGVLAKKQAEHLHEERYIGNEALHEMHTPSDQDLKDGLEIVEGLLRTVYVLPVHAARLQKRRTSKSSTKAAPTPKSKKK
jgi:hypothetical protein